MQLRFEFSKFFMGLMILFVANKLNSQSVSNDTLCSYIENLPDSGLVYFKSPSEIPKKIIKSIRKIENRRIRIVPTEGMSFDDIDLNKNLSGLVYFTMYEKNFYIMLKEQGFASTYTLKILIGDDSKILTIKNFKMTYPYYLDEFVHLKWGCKVYTAK